MVEIVYSPKALSDLEEISDYIYEELQNPEASLNTVNIIQDKIDKLAIFPNMGKLLSSIYSNINVNGYRFIVCESYLAFYRINEKNVYIDRIIYSRRDYITILFGELSND